MPRHLTAPRLLTLLLPLPTFLNLRLLFPVIVLSLY